MGQQPSSPISERTLIQHPSVQQRSNKINAPPRQNINIDYNHHKLSQRMTTLNQNNSMQNKQHYNFKLTFTGIGMLSLSLNVNEILSVVTELLNCHWHMTHLFTVVTTYSNWSILFSEMPLYNNKAVIQALKSSQAAYNYNDKLWTNTIIIRALCILIQYIMSDIFRVEKLLFYIKHGMKKIVTTIQ